MATTTRVLIIDDETKWQGNLRAWLPRENTAHDVAGGAAEAADLLRRFHYDLVLLDLSMDITNAQNRDSRGIQEYLATQPEGTQYFVVSATALKEDAVEAAYRLRAGYVFFKATMDFHEFAERALAVLSDASNRRAQSIAEARTRLIRNFSHESEILGALRPKDGPPGMHAILDSFLRALAPVAQHCDRPDLVKSGGCIVALLWSRRYGQPVSVVLANRAIPEAAAVGALDDWLGFPSRGEQLISNESHHVAIRAFAEPSVSDRHFNLPQIVLPG
jgi:CheY-like chemotaxis protein